MRVGVAQINIELLNLKKNVNNHIKFIRAAKKQNIDLLVFPELSLSGYFFNKKILEATISISDEIIDILKKESEGLRVVFGYPQEKRNFLVYNSMSTVYNKEVEFTYNKNNLPNYHHLNEKSIFTPSYELNGFEIDEKWKYSILICADMWNPSLVHQVMLDNTNLLIVPFNSAVKENISYVEGWEKCFDFYSMMYGSYIIGANRVGEEYGYKFYGNSVIMDPFGKVIVKAKSYEEDLIFADINYQEIREARFALPNLKNTI